MAERKKLVIIGGVAAGATAAARARRIDENADIIVVERGRYVSFANCGLPYRISGDIGKRSSLILQSPEGFFARYRVTVLTETEAGKIDRQAKKVGCVGPEGELELPYDSLILAQGGSPVMPPIEGSASPNVFRLWTIGDMDAIDAYLSERQPSSALVIGGGFIGLEAAEAFIKRGLATTIVELTDHLMPPADAEFGSLIARAFTEAGAKAIVGRQVKAIRPDSGTALLDDGASVGAGIVLVSAGVRPNLELAKAAGLETGPSGALAVDEFLRTSDPAVWAAGDMVEVTRVVDGRRTRIPLAGPANRQGRIAATNALGGSLAYGGALGTSVFKALDHTFGMTGLSEKAAREAGFEVGASFVTRGSHASYYPGAEDLNLKLVYDRKDGRLLGAQVFGKAGADKRVDVAATAIAAHMTIGDLASLDLAYAPPYSSANDPLNMAAFVAQNDASGFSPLISPEDTVRRVAVGTAAVLDVQTYGEYAKAHVAGSLAIPLDELRDRLDEVPSGSELIVVSKAGFEGHLAVRILLQAGFKARSVSGGMTALSLAAGFVAETEI